MRIASLVALLSFIHVTIARLLQINQWHEIPMLPCQRATLDFSLFGTCERFSLVFTSDRVELNRLSFTFDGGELLKVDVDSPTDVIVPKIPPVIGGCRQVERKSLRLNLSSRSYTFDVQLGTQVVIRPKRNETESIHLLLPQKNACCLIRGILVMDDEDQKFSATSTRKPKHSAYRIEPKPVNTTNPVAIVNLKSTRKGDPFTRLTLNSSHSGNRRRLFTDSQAQSTAVPTSIHDVQLLSWTDVVNREWSVPFLVCSFSVLIMMIIMVSIGMCFFIYLQTRPASSKRYCSIED